LRRAGDTVEGIAGVYANDDHSLLEDPPAASSIPPSSSYSHADGDSEVEKDAFISPDPRDEREVDISGD
jgi:hypothetical protein